MSTRTLLFFLFLLPSFAWSADPISTGFFNDLAVKGYDAVAYHLENKPVKGDKAFAWEWQGATWRFSSQANLDLFKGNPEKYAPQYGGYCAWAVANNKLAGIDPTQFSVVEGKLYLNYNKKIQKKWLADRDAFIQKGDANWPAVLSN